MIAEVDDAVASGAANAEQRHRDSHDERRGSSLVELARRARCPDRSTDADVALDALVERLYPLCERFLARRLRSFRDAQDVAADAAQETMVRIATALDTCRAATDRELVAWVLVTARRTLIDMYRSPATGLAARSLAVELDDDADVTDAPEDGEGARGAPRRTLLALALQAYDALTNETAELLWWRLVGGAEWSEVAEQLATTPGGAKRRFQRAQTTLRRSVTALVSQLPPGQRAPVEALVATYRAGEAAARGARGGPEAEQDAA